MNDIIRYPRTRHLEGSRKSGDDFELTDIPFEELIGKYLVIESKIDGSNSGISFSDDGELLLQSRGHFLRGGAGEKEFVQFKMWANIYKHDLYDILGKRYIWYSENLLAKHTVFYDNLPHYVFEFDIYDKEKSIFLSTKARRRLLEGLDYQAVPVVYEGPAVSLDHLKSFIGRSIYKTDNWLDNFKNHVSNLGLDVDIALKQTDLSDLDEGIYGKIETEEETIGRFKFVRQSFVQKIIDSNKETNAKHWKARLIIPNILSNGKVSLF